MPMDFVSFSISTLTQWKVLSCYSHSHVSNSIYWLEFCTLLGGMEDWYTWHIHVYFM